MRREGWIWCAVLLLFIPGGAAGAGLPANGGPVPNAPTAGSSVDTAGEAAPRLADVRFGGLLQAWYLDGSSHSPSSFRLRRGMLKFSGSLSASSSWTLSVDPAKALKLRNSYAVVGQTQAVSDTRPNQASLMLQDAYLSVRGGRMRVDVGQMRVPVGLEGSVLSSAKLETIERSLFAAAGKLTQVRDVGVLARLQLPARLGVALGVFNGLGEDQNATDTDNAKAMAGRLSYGTPVPGLDLGLSGAWGGERSGAAVRRRVGVDVAFVRGSFKARAEWLRASSGDVRQLGYYGLAAYRHRRWEGVVRYDVWDPEVGGVGGGGVRTQDYLVGGSYFFADSPLSFKVNYIRRRSAGVGGTNLFLVALQAAW